MATMTYVPSRIGEGFFIDVPVPGSGDDDKALTYDHGTGNFVYTAFDAAGTAAAAVAAHVAAGDPHTQYELESNNTAAAILTKVLTVDGAGSGLDADLLDGQSSAYYLPAASFVPGGSTTQVLFNDGGAWGGDAGLTYAKATDRLTVAGGLVAPSMRPASNSTTALQWLDASGTALLTGDTTNLDVQRAGVPTADSSVITRGYSVSKLMNMIPNGSGLLGNNYNFSGFTFDGAETHGGGGSFKYTGGTGILYSSEYIPVDIEKYYRIVAWSMAGNTDGTNYDAANVQLAGVVCYDIDKLLIYPNYTSRFVGSAQTTLAAQLNPSDTTVTLTDATGWQNAGAGYERQFTWWPYINGQGYNYPNYTYSRYSTYDTPGYVTPGAWGSGGISGTTITLTAAWAGPTLAAGTPVQNAPGGNTFKYNLQLLVTVPNTWTRYEGFIGGIDTAGTNDTNRFPYGCAYVQLVFVLNLSPTASTNIIRYSDFWFSELSVKNLERFNTSGDLVLQSYSSGTRPTAGTAGRVVWNTTTSRPNFDTGSGWILADGTAA